MLLRRSWPPPPDMDRRAYARYRLSLTIGLLAWLAAAIAVVGFWAELHLIAKGIAVAICVVVTPSVGCIKQVFARYERYSQHGLEY